ncbi:MAG: mannose-6-phosphate isomerase, class I [Microbacterium sp.]|nr:mannose-6-phosphate isomerase, class I [Microbacterium sp.]
MLELMTNTPRDYAWGSTTLLAELEGREPTGAPEAEVWFGDHPGSPAVLADGTPLPERLAEASAGPLPYLLKLLAAGSPLSIQVHPSRAQAQAGWAKEAGLAMDAPERNYRDDNHKPELIVSLSERFEALCGLRPLDASRRYLAALGEAEGVRELRALLDPATDGTDADILRRAIEQLLSGDCARIVSDVTDALATASSAEFADELAAARRIAAVYPGDPGIVVAMLMNLAVLGRGEAVYLRAGLLHAYLSGIGVEIMAASDNVLRGGLTPKRVDVPELLSLLDTTPGIVPVIHPQPLTGATAVETYGPGVADFALAVARPDAESGVIADIHVDGPAVVVSTAGECAVEADGERVLLAPGQAAIALGTSGPLRIGGTGEVFIATPGESIDSAS